MTSICLIVALLAAASIGFQVGVTSKRDFIIAELIHRDSYMSQLDSSLKSTTPTSSGMILRESTKSNRINNFNTSSIHDIDERYIVSEVTHKEGDYLLKINTGGQVKLLLLSAALTSTLIFGEPCKGCHKQDAQRFPPSLANTNHFVGKSIECQLLRSYMETSSSGTMCIYRRNEQGLDTHGVLSRVTSSFSFSRGTEGDDFHLWFVRVFKSESDPLDSYVEGLVGLGPGPYSLITQLAWQLNIPKKFSYCFSEDSSKIIFGQKTWISTEKVTTPFVTEYATPYYYLSLRAIRVGKGSKMKVLIMKEQEDMVILSERVKTQLRPQTYDGLADYIKLFIDDSIGGVPVHDDYYSLCYHQNIQKYVPHIALEFDRRAIIELPRANTYTLTSDSKVCLTILGAKSRSFSVLGTQAQHGFEVEYDLDKSEISFTKTDCNKFGIQ